jgi:hypothetical protein
MQLLGSAEHPVIADRTMRAVMKQPGRIVARTAGPALARMR